MLIFIPQVSWANNSICLGLFSLQAFGDDKICDRIISTMKGVDDICVSFLFSTFGKSLTCPKKLIQSYPNMTLRIHSTNGSCRHGTRICAKEEVNMRFRDPAYSRAIISSKKVRAELENRVKEIASFISEYPSVKWEVSTGLEEEFTREAYNIVYKLYKKNLPKNVKIVRSQNPTHRPLYYPHGVIIELHGNWDKNPYPGRKCHYSSDGKRLFALTRHKDASPKLVYERMSAAIREARKLDCGLGEIWVDRIQGSFLYDRFVFPRSRTLKFSNHHSLMLNRFLKGK